MPKFEDVAKLFASKIGNTELTTAIEEGTLDEFEIEEEAFEGLKTKVTSLMTPEAALNNPEIINKMKDELHQNAKASIYGNVEKKMRSLGEKFGVELAEGARVDEMFETFGEIDLSAKGGGKLTDSEKKAFNDEIKGLNNQLAKIKEEHETQIASLQTGFEQTRLNAAIDQKLSSFQLAEPYQKDVVKRGIFQTIKSELGSTATLKLNEAGQIEVFQKEHPDKRIFDQATNQEMNFDSLIKPMMNEYMMKSGGSGASGSGSKRKPESKVQPTANPNSMMELMKKQRQEHFQSQ